ncbi:MAG: hypothetical protein JNK88_12430, partial [Mangrovicoccus sp.]|nr:hypothetical protein [Mangrovicoccus sp.]
MSAGKEFGQGAAGHNVWLWPGVTLAVGVGAVALGLWRFAPPPQPVPPATPPAGVATAVVGAPGVTDAMAAKPPASPEAPRFDLVRVEPGGETLVAGRALPGRKVAILLDGQAVGEAETDAAGQFVAFVGLPSSAEARVMSLAAEAGDGGSVASAETVIVAGDGSVPAGQVVATGALAAGPVAAPADRPAAPLPAAAAPGPDTPSVAVAAPA